MWHCWHFGMEKIVEYRQFNTLRILLAGVYSKEVRFTCVCKYRLLIGRVH